MSRPPPKCGNRRLSPANMETETPTYPERPPTGAAADFLLGFADALMSAGTQTSRVARNVERLAGNSDTAPK